MSDYGEDAEMGQLLAEKERELIALSRARIQRLEDQVRTKDLLCEEMKGKLAQMQEDFNYNLSLIDGRDAELEDLENKLEVLKNACREKEEEAEELRDALRTADERIRSFEDRKKQNDRQFQDNRSTLREQIAALQFEKSEYIKQKDDEMRSLRSDYEARLRDKELEVMTAVKGHSQSLEMTLRSRDEQVQGLKAQLIQSQNVVNSLRTQIEELLTSTQNNELLQERIRTLVEQNENMHVKYDAMVKEKTEAYFKVDQEARNLRFSEQTLRQELTHLQNLQEEDKLAQQREIAQLKEQQERELTYIGQIKEASIEKLQTTHGLQLKRLQDKLSEAMDDNERLAIQCQSLKARLEDSERLRTHEAEEVRDSTAGDLAKLKKIISEVRSELATKCDEIENLNLNLERCKATITTQEREIRRLEGDLETANYRNSDLERNTESRLKQRQASTELESIQRILRKRDEEIERLKGDLQECKTDLEAAHMENQDLEVAFI